MTAAPTSTTLGWVLDHAASLPWDHAIYLPSEERWTLTTRCLVLNPDDCADNEGEPAEARARGLRYALGVQDVKGIVDNARQQSVHLSAEDLFGSFLYYYDHDAFIDLSARRK